MELLIRNAEGNVSSTDRDYAAKKLGRLDRFFHAAQKVEMVHREEGHGQHKIEVTVHADGFIIRGVEHDETVHAAIDKVMDKLETRLRKLKGRIISSHRRRGNGVPAGFHETHKDVDESHHIEIKDRKHFLLEPMSVEEAALQMEMVDHNFFVFKNEDTGQVAVLFRRKDRQYGLLETEQ